MVSGAPGFRAAHRARQTGDPVPGRGGDTHGRPGAAGGPARPVAPRTAEPRGGPAAGSRPTPVSPI
ncbi:hypothetical protein CVT27_13830 [Streptomyces cavourensis]|nr:hypothetical protein CVT27_13830 [Streptomyces cavourensis]